MRLLKRTRGQISSQRANSFRPRPEYFPFVQLTPEQKAQLNAEADQAVREGRTISFSETIAKIDAMMEQI